MYTVKQLSELAKVSIRTLHYYDEIGLLKPQYVGENGYRYYDDRSLLRLQQILFFWEMDMELSRIRKILDDKKFDSVSALQVHRQALQDKINRLQTLIKTIDTTIMHLTGEVNMNNKQTIFEGFNAEKQKQYEDEAKNLWGENVTQSIKLWNSYSAEQKEKIMQEGSAIYTGIAAQMQLGAESPAIQALLGHWHQHLRYFYEPSLEVLRGLGENYYDHPDFNATFTAIHPDLPAFLKKAILHYVDALETRWLKQELGILKE